jgi:hypothetical protein
MKIALGASAAGKRAGIRRLPKCDGIDIRPRTVEVERGAMVTVPKFAAIPDIGTSIQTAQSIAA